MPPAASFIAPAIDAFSTLLGNIRDSKLDARFWKSPMRNSACPFHLPRSAMARGYLGFLCPRMIHRAVHSCEVHFPVGSCAYSFLGVVESACFWSIRSTDTTVSARETGDLSHRWPASLAEEFTRVQRTTRRIFDVKVLLPRLVCSASKFQTSCLWNLTHACLAEATTRARFACGALPLSDRSRGCIYR